MDVLTFLEQDHAEAKRLFEQIGQAEVPQAARLWAGLKQALVLHEQLEETYLYPELRRDPNARDLVLEAYQEHHIMDVLIAEISALPPSSEGWRPKVKVLQENTEHHIEEEEGELFPKVRKVWDAKKREEVGDRMQEVKRGQARTG